MIIAMHVFAWMCWKIWHVFEARFINKRSSWEYLAVSDCKQCTGHFIMFSVITNICYKKTKGPTLMELFTERVFFFTTRDVWCVHHGWHSTHRYDIQVLATPTSIWVHPYSSLLQWSMSLGQRGHVALDLCILCTVTTDLLMWYSNTQNDFSPGAAIFYLHSHRLAAEMW
jgi:hypothetical protein